MSDELTSLAATMQAKKGIFALLLGSGVSRSAQIPTAWNIIEDLIKRVAVSKDESAADGPAAWYLREFGIEPEYGAVLDLVAKSPAERSQIIRPYIEPTEEERELGLKQPTAAHRAIATLVAQGYIRVIVTTNFDRLLESALTDVGITPSVISSPDSVNGTLPLVHNNCTIIKIHGDYVDARIRNTADELAAYPEELQTLLSQVFREYGLVVSGWSGDWDTALRASLQGNPSPWFSTYWVSYRDPSVIAQEVITTRQAQVVTNMDADSFFQHLSESVASLDDLQSPELLSVAIAEASLKRYIDDPTKRIRIHDLVVGEATRVRRSIGNASDSVYLEQVEKASLTARLELYEESTATLRALFVTGCYWGKPEHTANWINALDRLGSFSLVSQFYQDWLSLRFYPALLVLYAGGVAAVASNNYSALTDMLYRTTTYEPSVDKRVPLIFSANLDLLEHAAAQTLYRADIPQGYALPHRIRESAHLWTTLSAYVPSKDLLDAHFDMFEYLFGLALVDQRLELRGNAWAPKGLFALHHHRLDLEGFLQTVNEDIEQYGDAWPPLKAGMFGGSTDRLHRACEIYDQRLKEW